MADATELRLRAGTKAEVSAFIGAPSEVVHESTTNTLIVFSSSGSRNSLLTKNSAQSLYLSANTPLNSGLTETSANQLYWKSGGETNLTSNVLISGNTNIEIITKSGHIWFDIYNSAGGDIVAYFNGNPTGTMDFDSVDNMGFNTGKDFRVFASNNIVLSCNNNLEIAGETTTIIGENNLFLQAFGNTSSTGIISLSANGNINVFASGNVVLRGSSIDIRDSSALLYRLATSAGSSGQILTSNGTGNNLIWTTPTEYVTSAWVSSAFVTSAYANSNYQPIGNYLVDTGLTGQIVVSNGNGTPTWDYHGEHISGQIEGSANAQTYTICLKSPFAWTVTSAAVQTSAGTANILFSIDGTGITGLTAVGASAGSINARNATAANTVNVGSRLRMQINSPTSLQDVFWTLAGRRN